MRKIRILNPVEGESPFKMERQAMKLVHRGHAVEVADGQIRYTDTYRIERMRQLCERSGLAATGRWVARQCGRRAIGGPSHKTMQLDTSVGRFAK